MFDSRRVLCEAAMLPGHHADGVVRENGERESAAVNSTPNSSWARTSFVPASIPSVLATSRTAVSWETSCSSVEIDPSVNRAISSILCPCESTVLVLKRAST